MALFLVLKVVHPQQTSNNKSNQLIYNSRWQIMPSKCRISAQKFTQREQQQPMSVDVDIQFCTFLCQNIVNKVLSWIQFNPERFQIHNGGYEPTNWKITLSRAQ